MGVKISALPDASVPLNGAELVPLDQGGVTKKASVSAIVGNAGSSTFSGAYVRHTAPYTMPSNDVATIPFTSTRYDLGGFVHAGDDTFIYAPAAGWYHVSLNISWAYNLTGINSVGGSPFGEFWGGIGYAQNTLDSDSYGLSQSPSGDCSLAAGERVYVRLFNFGAAINATTFLAIHRLAIPAGTSPPPPPPPPPFVPSDIAGLAFWQVGDVGTWQNTAGSTTASATGNPIARWDDQSGNLNTPLQATSGDRPTLVALGRHGHNTVAFDGATQLLAAGDTPSLDLGNTLTLYVVLKDLSGGSGDHGVVSKGLNAYGVAVESGEFFAAKSGVANVARTSSGVSGAWHICGWLHNAGGDTIRLDGADDTTIISSQTLINNVHDLEIGADNGIILYHGEIAEIVLYGSVLSAADRDRVETYLNARYAIY